MCASPWRSCKSAYCDEGIATMAEYILLLGISLAIFLALFAAFSVAATTAENDATAIAAYNIASSVSASISEVAGDGTASARATLDLPGDICSRPYIVYPSADGRHMVVMVGRAAQPQKYAAPLEMCTDGVRIAGFMAGGQEKHSLAYDVDTGTVTIS
ncbi:hypothetical protein [Methanocella sp. MCL-LM]|uniref:hypothetical protein n=1 Tax=Methanocella sp. MCL-LM TaxID=3412035 RepID=UPI003C786AC0